jgi:hypothetical protein
MFPLPLVIETRNSATARAVLLVAHLAALAALFLAALPAPPRIAGCLLLGASLWLAWRRQDAPHLRGKVDGRMEIWRDAAWRPLQLLPDSTALPWLIVLRWREGRRHHSLALPADALPGEDHRRLRVWLRWKAKFPQGSLQ